MLYRQRTTFTCSYSKYNKIFLILLYEHVKIDDLKAELLSLQAVGKIRVKAEY